MPESMEEKARKQSLLGIILLALHPLFGITAIIGMLISTMSLKSTAGTIYHSHLKWQIATFWVAFAAYLLAFGLWLMFGQTWAVVLGFGFVVYRLIVNLNHWAKSLPLNRLV